MGLLYYGNASDEIEIPDRLLAHVKVVMTTKLRRGESFTVSWVHAAGTAGGRSTIWLDPSIPLRFVFDSAEAEELDSALLTELAREANATSGLMIPVEVDVRTPLAAVVTAA